MSECIFCDIIDRKIDAKIVFENDLILAFNDISPVAPYHIIIVPKVHINSTNEITDENSKFVAEIFRIVPIIAKENNFGQNGYRVVNNCGVDGGQTVNHIHFHLLAGRNFEWPPG